MIEDNKHDKKNIFINPKTPHTIMNVDTLPLISAESLGNSLFECVTIDIASGNRPLPKNEPTMVKVGIICLCLRGEGTLTINEQPHKIGKGSLVTLLPNSVIKNSSSNDFLGYTIAIDTKFLMSVRVGNAVKSYVHISANPVLKISDKESSSVIELCEILRHKRGEGSNCYSKEITRHLLTALCYEIHALYRSKNAELKSPSHLSRQESICQKFFELVEHHAVQHRNMSFYADKLCITPKYLSVVISKTSGSSPVEWIDRTVMLYARTLLSSSDMTVQQIAAELNFPNPSFFGQYFKRHSGVTPKKYRTQRQR